MSFSDLAGGAGERPTTSATHTCSGRKEHSGVSRRGPGADLPEARYGPAFEEIECFDGKWWAHNEEYAMEVTFCPWCGVRLDSDWWPEGTRPRNARFPHGPSALAFALKSDGSILNTTGPAASRKVAEGTFQVNRDQVGGSLREPNGSLPESAR